MTTASPTLNAQGVFAYATDPDATSGELLFDFVAGSVGLVIAGAVVGVAGTLAKTLDNTTVAASGATEIANYSYDWAGSNGDPWADWTTVTGTVDIQSGKGRQLTAATANASAKAYYNTPLPQNYELRIDGTPTTVTAAEFYGAINLRAGSTTFNHMMQHSSWHLRFVGTATTGTAELYRVNSAGVETFLTSGSDIDFVQGSVLHVRLWLAGQVFRARYWKNAESEPSTWQISGTDSSAPTGSGLSLAVRNGPDAAADDWRWDDLTITTDVSGTVATTLANTVSTTVTGASGAAGTLAETLDDTTATTTSGTLNITTVAPSLNTNGVYAYATDPAVSAGLLGFDFVAGGVALLLEGATTGVTAGTVAETLGTIQSGSPILDQNSLPILDEDGEPIVTDATFGTHGPGGGTVARTLAGVTSVATGSSVGGTFARTLSNVTSIATGGSSGAGVLAETLDPVVLQAVGGSGARGTVNLQLDDATSAATGSHVGTGVTGTLARTLASVEANAPLVDDLGAAITDENSLPLLVRGAEGTHGIGGTVAKTLANVTSTTSGFASSVTGTLAETLDGTAATAAAGAGAAGTAARTLANAVALADGIVAVTGFLAKTLGNATAAAAGTAALATISGTVAKTLGNAATTTAGTVGVTGDVAKTLANVTSSATGTSDPVIVAGNVGVTLAAVTTTTTGTVGVTGTLAETLDNATSAATGTFTPALIDGTAAVTLATVTSAADGLTFGGPVAVTLADATMAADGTAGPMPVDGTLAVTLAAVIVAAEGYPTVLGEFARTLSDVLGFADGTTVAGVIDVLLDDVTSATTANVSITVYGVGSIEAVYQAGPIDTVFETGRIVAVAGSAH